MKKFYKKFSSKVELIDELLKLNPEAFNVSATKQMNQKASRNRYYLVDNKDFVRVCDNFKKFMFMFNHVSGVKVYHKICFGNGHIFHVFTQEDVFGQGGNGGTLSGLPSTQETPKIVQEEEKEIITEKKEEDATLDLSKYETLYDESKKRASKDALEKAVRQDFNIDLNKRNPFEGMIEELREELSKK
ncbi:coil containing protein [Vibrio phage 1.101.O._10N.261.45.C6]|nr:coil containing protein [Vibrio phage 1.101.O._10N.261.45.C6]